MPSTASYCSAIPTWTEAAGRLGLGLIGVYFTIDGTMGVAYSAARFFHSAPTADASLDASALASVAVPLLTGVLPGMGLVLFRRPLSRSLFSGPSGEFRVDGITLAIIGLALLGVYFVVRGLVLLIHTLTSMLVASDAMSMSDSTETFALGLATSLTHVLLGWYLVRRSPRIAKWL